MQKNHLRICLISYLKRSIAADTKEAIDWKKGEKQIKDEKSIGAPITKSKYTLIMTKDY